MVYCVQLVAAFSSAARRDAVENDIVSRITGKSRWSVDVIGAGGNRVGPNGLIVELRFVSNLDADDLRARVEAFAANTRAPLAGSWIRVHNCTHDEGTDACVISAERTW